MGSTSKAAFLWREDFIFSTWLRLQFHACVAAQIDFEQMHCSCGAHFLECMALLRFHSFSVPSSEAVRSTAWLGWKVRARIASKWLRSVKRGFHVFLNSSLLSCICYIERHIRTHQCFCNVSPCLMKPQWMDRNWCLITSMERSLSLATVRSASSPRFMSPPPTASMMKTSDENPRAPPTGGG